MRQDVILAQVAGLVRPGGRLVYSTCTFAPDEDEGTVARFLNGHPEFSLVEPPALPGLDRGRPDWLPEPLRRPELTRCVRLWPHHVAGEGHFAALLRKEASDRHAATTRARPLPRLARNVVEAYDRFVAESLWEMPASGQLVLAGSYLYAVPPGLPDLTGLHYLHAGWWLGELKRERFEPSHALALGVKPDALRRVVSFGVDDPALLAYMRGETGESPGEDGWVLVAVDGFGLGWAKRVGGRLKSHYPKGLRIVGG